MLTPIALELIMDRESDFYQLPVEEDKKFKPYYVAHTKIRTLALLDEGHKGSNWYQWRREKDSNLRDPKESNSFQDCRIQPLCHPSQ